MSHFAVITDSSCDLPASLVEELGIHVVPLSFLMDEQSYCNYPDNRDMSPEEFYEKLAAGSMPTTNAVNVDQATQAMKQHLEQGEDVLVLGFSSALSATYNSFAIAADDLKGRYAGRKICVVDTLSASVGQGLLVYHAAMMCREGKSLEETRDWVEANKLHVCHWVTVNDLFHLKRGGRVSSTTAVLGTMLQIKPMLYVNPIGKLIALDKVRGRRIALNKLTENIVSRCVDEDKTPVFISHGDCEDEALAVADMIKATMPNKEIVLNHIGPVIGAHSGYRTLAVFCLGNGRGESREK